MCFRNIKLGEVITHRKEFIVIDNSVEYKRCRVQVNRKGIVLRDVIKGSLINTKKQQVCTEGDFLVAEIDAKVGGYGFVPKDLDGAIVSSHYFLFDVDETKMLKSYLAWLIKTDILQDQINSKGSTNYAAIRPNHVLNFDIPLPSVNEQRDFVERLNNIDAEHSLLVLELEKQGSYLLQLRQVILEEAVKGKLIKQSITDEPASKLLDRIQTEKKRLIKEGKLKKGKIQFPITKEEMPLELPNGWMWCRLGDILTMMDAGWSPACLNRSANAGEWGVLKTTSVQEMKYLELENKELPGNLKPKLQYEVHVGDILITRAGPFNRVGVCCLVKETRDKLMISDKIIRFHLFDKFLNPEFITLCLNAGESKKFIEGKKSGMAVSQVNISQDNLKLTPIPLPPFSEQHRIVTKVQQLLQMINQLKLHVVQSNIQVAQIQQAVLIEAFGGNNKVVKDEEMLILAQE